MNYVPWKHGEDTFRRLDIDILHWMEIRRVREGKVQKGTGAWNSRILDQMYGLYYSQN